MLLFSIILTRNLPPPDYKLIIVKVAYFDFRVWNRQHAFAIYSMRQKTAKSSALAQRHVILPRGKPVKSSAVRHAPSKFGQIKLLGWLKLQSASLNARLTYYRPAEITCDGLGGWSHQEASCDANNGGIPPGAQIAIIMIALGMLCAGTFAWQKYYRKTEAARE